MGVVTLSAFVSLTPQGPEGSAIVRGRVVDAVTGKPLPNIFLSFYPQPTLPYTPGIDAQPPKRNAMTGADGTFEIPRLMAAEYSVSGGPPPGYLSIEHGVTRAGGPGKLLKVADGAKIDITLRAWRSATIGGHVYDERGRPVIGAQVRVFEKDSEVYGSDGTDDLGAYEIVGLRPGQYTVGVTIGLWNRTLTSKPGRQASYEPGMTPFILDRARRTILMSHEALLPASADDGRPRIYVTSFAGGASTKASALFVPLGPGDVRGEIDITLIAVRGTRVAGVVGGPADVTGTVLRLRREGTPRDYDPSVISATAAADGSFVFVATPPGRYILTAERRRPPLTEVSISGGTPAVAQDDVITRDEEDYWADFPIAVGDADIDDLAVTLNAGTPLTGRIVYENGDDAAARAPNRQPNISLAAETSRPFSENDRYVRIERDGRVAMRIRPGRYRVSGTAGTGLVVKTTLVNGRELGDDPLVVGADPLTDVQFILGRHDTVVRGTVADTKGQPSADAAILIFPADKAKWFRLEQTGRGQWKRTSNAVWQFTGVAPGEYYVVALESFRGGLNEALAETLVPLATRITVRAGVPAELRLVVKDPE